MSANLLIMVVAFFIMLFIQIPIGITIGFASIIYIILSKTIPLTMLGTSMFTALDSFPLMAIPLFIMTGALIEGGGLARKLVNFASAFVGNITGGYAMATIVTCAFFGAISGSALATVAAIGIIIVPTMLENGYSKNFSYGLICAAGCLGIIIPPSIPMVMYSAATDVSVGTMFVGGFGPGILCAGILMIFAYFMSKKRGYHGNGVRFTFKNVFKTFIDAVWALIIPVIILGGIYGGFFTPTEAAAVAATYSAIAGKFIYKELTWKKFVAAIENSAITNATILFVCATATFFGRVLTMAQVPAMLIVALKSISESPLILLLIINLVLLVVGCFMDTVAAIVILAPMLLPVIVSYGIDPIHFGLIMVFNLAIGLCTPPVGSNLFVASGIGKIQFNLVVKSVVPFLGALFVTLFLLTFVPNITLFLPRLLGIYK